MELEGKSVEDRIAPNVLELGVVQSGGRGLGLSCSAGSYHPYLYQQNKVSSSSSVGRSSRRRSLPPSPFATASALTATTTEDPHLFEAVSHPQQQQQQAPGKNSRKMRRYNKKLGTRLRRATQAAPNNNNEFLMQEHDPLYHLDGDQVLTEDDSNSDEQTHPDHHRHRSHRYSSSPEEDEEDFLTRDFSNAYEVVHAERLYNMSKIQLIHEYQLMEERVEFLENKLRSALLEKETRTDVTKSEAIPVPLVTAAMNNLKYHGSANDSLFSSSQGSLGEDDDEDRFQFIYN